jgi:hypothetical protein
MLSSEQLGDSELQSEYLNSVKQNKTADELVKFYAVKWLMKHDLKNGSAKTARNFTSTVESGSKYDRELSLELAQGLFEYLGDKDGAEEILDNLSKRFTDKDTEEDINFIKKHINTFSPSLYKESSNNSGETSLSDETEYSFGAYPNPFNPSTVIRYQLPDDAYVTLKVYDILGSEVAALIDNIQSPGSHEVTFNGSNLSSGVYIYTLRLQSKTNSYISSKKMLLLK